MSDLVQFIEKPRSKELIMIAGWRQWADAGSISSALPEYLIEVTNARKIGELRVDGCYLFQIPGTHHLLRPVIKLEDGYRVSMETHKNEIYFAGDGEKGMLIFLGDEPHLNADLYGDAFFNVIHTLNVRRVAAVGGVYGPVPYDRDREVGCIYSLRRLRSELEEYALRFSNYEGGATIGSLLVDRAEREDVEFLAFYAFVPNYDFNQPNILPQGVRIEYDYKAWYDLMRRFNHMFGMKFDLGDLEEKSMELIDAMEAQIVELEEKIPDLKSELYLQQVADEFTEQPFNPLDDVWAEGLEDLFGDGDGESE
jgi:proteasome assembly chaperone (PAC2) family protein